MGVLVGLGVGVGLMLCWSAFFVPRSAPRARRTRSRVGTLLARAGMSHLAPTAFITLCVGCALAATLVVEVVSGTPPVAMLFGVMAGFLPVWIVSGRARRRQRDFAEVWPEAVDHLASAVRAGLSLPDALAQLSVRGPEPLRDSFAAFALDYQVTGRFGECLDRLKDRLADPVGDRVVEGLRVAREVGGGELGRLLRNLSGYLRDEAPHPLRDGVASGLDRERRPAGRGRAVAGAADDELPARGDPPLRLAGRHPRPRGGRGHLPGRLPADDAHRPAAHRAADPLVTGAALGMLVGTAAGLGLVLVVSRLRALHRPTLALRVLPYLRDVPRVGRTTPPDVASSSPVAAAAGVFGPLLKAAADGVEKVLGGSASVRRRLQRAGLDRTVHDFRVEQVQWGVVGFAVVAAYCLLTALAGGGGVVSSLLLCATGFAVGVLARDTYLSSQVTTRERRMLAEFPTVAELLALAVAAGESPVAALDRVVRRSGGELSRDLAGVLAAVRTGEPVSEAFDRLARVTGLPLVARFAQGVAVAVERGTPLAEVLHAQAADVREAGRRELIEVAARKEIFMMVPVVFLILPVTVLVAFWPGVIGLQLTTP